VRDWVAAVSYLSSNTGQMPGGRLRFFEDERDYVQPYLEGANFALRQEMPSDASSHVTLHYLYPDVCYYALDTGLYWPFLRVEIDALANDPTTPDVPADLVTNLGGPNGLHTIERGELTFDGGFLVLPLYAPGTDIDFGTVSLDPENPWPYALLSGADPIWTDLTDTPAPGKDPAIGLRGGL
jgi:hypothetical protein